ncbi:MAG: elongation factor 1-beta [Candidatus Nanohaloarchaea archaeon]|nr:elongation factor 1-beta [Candidatus Nanohaloarchaea archaeon]
MGEIGVVMKLMPDGPDTDIEAIKEEARKRIDVNDMDVEDVAFGLQAVMVSTVVEDQEGGTDEVEEQLGGIDGVQSVEVEDIQKL